VLIHPTAHSHFDGDLSLPLTPITVFPTAKLDLGNVMIEHCNVNFDPTDPDVTLKVTSLKTTVPTTPAH
jgi:hypothetical protein